MKSLIILFLSALPLLTAAQTELTPEQEVEKARKELEVAQKKLAEARRRAEEAQQINGDRTHVDAGGGWSTPHQNNDTGKKQSESSKRLDKKSSKSEDISSYLALDAVPLVEGIVEWKITVVAPSICTDTLYKRCEHFLNSVVHSNKSLAESRVALLNEREHKIIASMREAMTIQSAYLSLNHPTFCYVLQTTCSDGKATLTMNRMAYQYQDSGKQEVKKAEEWIIDQEAVNEKHTRLQPFTGKVRRTTIDRKNELFADFERAMRQ